MSRKPLNDKNTTPGLVPLGPIPSDAPVAAFNTDLHESLLRTKGFKAVHYRAALHPQKEEVNSPSKIKNSEVAHRGFRYYSPRVVSIVPQRFSIEEKLMIQGGYKTGSTVINVSGYYLDEIPDESNVVHVNIDDLLVFPSLTYKHRQLFEYNAHGLQKLKYKVQGVDVLFDDERDYKDGVDFDVYNGKIRWLSGQRPKSKSVMSCNYYITPIYVVKDFIHHLRVIPANDVGYGGLTREAIYAPQQFVVAPSHLREEENILDYETLPDYPAYDYSFNTSGGNY